MRSRELAAQLGIQPEHVHANRLIDYADQQDREGYKAALDKLRQELPDPMADRVEHLARWQIQMKQRYHRLFAWRSDWVRHNRG